MSSLLNEKEEALSKVAVATLEKVLAVCARDEAIRSALEVCSVREVAVSAGLSPARVHQIRHGR